MAERAARVSAVENPSIVLDILWGWQIDRIAPDRFDLLGGLIALTGVFVIMYWPRG